MSRRPLLLGTFLAASVGVPYVMHHPTLKQTVGRVWSAAVVEQPAVTLQSDAYPAIGATTPVPERLEGPVVTDLAQVFRYDITTSWIMSHWSRVSTAAGELDQQGYRVPLVTGTRHDDLAGVLTYYFDSQQQLRRITFRGTTGDTRRLVSLVAGRFGLSRQASAPSHLVRYELLEGREPGSTLEINLAPVVRGDRPHERFEVSLVLSRPSSELASASDEHKPGQPRPYQFKAW